MLSSNLNILQNISLRPYNTFGIDASAKYFCVIHHINEFEALIKSPEFIESNQKLFLGGGSNILFTKDFDGIVIRIDLKGIRIIKESAKYVYLEVGAGEIWHDLVLFCVENNLYGIENLSLIPGTVGAAPIQNIGAYGVEVKDTIMAVETLELRDCTPHLLKKAILKFGYRDSIFKNEAKDKYVITKVHFRLRKVSNINISYGALKLFFENPDNQLSIKAVSDAIIKIRQSKLPDPKLIGNAGSFFKNPTVSLEKLLELQNSFPSIPNYPIDNKFTKLAAGWLIEQCGWKGKRVGDCGVHADQALVLVNYGNASGSEIFNLAQEIITDVKAKFDIALTTEVNIL